MASRREEIGDDLSDDFGDYSTSEDHDGEAEQACVAQSPEDANLQIHEDPQVQEVLEKISQLRTNNPDEVPDLPPEVVAIVQSASQLALPPNVQGKLLLNIVCKQNISINEKGKERFVLPGGGMKRAKELFVKTEGYRHVKETLDEFGHVIITGAPGCGKTTIAYYIMSKYEQHCEVVFVDDLTRFKFERDINLAVPTLLVLDDVFGHFSLTPNEVVRCKQVFTDMNNHFSRLEEKRKKRNKGDKSEMDDTGDSTLKVIMTSRTNVMEMIKNRFRNYQHSLLRPSAVANLTTLTKLTQLEKENILTKHLAKVQRTLKPDIIRSISSQEYKSLGYPHLCQLFVDSCISEKSTCQFFRKPISYLVGLLTDVFQDTQESKGRACVLLLMILNDGVLSLTDLQSEERKRESGLASKISKCREILGDIPESELCRVAKQDISSFLAAEGDVMKFSHPTMHDAVAFVVGDKNQTFILENCSLQFIIERTKVVENTASPSGGDYNTFVINLTKETAIFLVKRLAKEIVDHNFALPLSHSCFSSKDMVDCLFQELSSLSSKEETLHSLDSQYGLGFLFWAAFISEGRVFETALLNSSFDLHEVSEGCLGFCMSGNGVSLGTLLSQFSEDKVEIINKRIGEVFPTSSDTKALYRTISSVPSQTKQETSDEKETLTSRMHGDNQDQLIHIAAANGFPDVVETLIQHGAEIDAKGGNDMTALMYACYLGHVTLVRMLLKQGANPRLLDEEADNCLHLACRDGSLDTVKMLYDERMDVNIRGEYERSPLMYAAWNGHEDVVNFLLENGAEAEPDVTSLKNKDNCLHLACIKGHKKVVEILLTKGNMSTDAMGEVSRTPIMFALRHGQLETAKVLREREAELDKVDKFGFNCLHLASMSGDVPTAEWLLKETRIGGDTDKALCLRLALQHGRIEMTQYWCENGASLSYVDENGTSCINFASRSGRQELVDMCLDARLDVNARNSFGLTPAIEACKFGHVDLLKYLVLKGADVINPPGCLHVAAQYAHVDVLKYLLSYLLNIGISTPGFNGRTPLIHACAGGQVEIAECLKKLGASLAERDTWGQTCLHTACRYRHIDMVIWLVGQQEVDVNNEDENGKTSLMTASKADSPEIIDILVKAGADINKDDDNGRTPLHVAAYYGKTNACSALLNHGANVNARDNRSGCPLHSVARNPSDQCSIARILIDNDATVDARDNQSKTPAMYAVREHNVRVLEVLLSNGADVDTMDDRGWRGTLLHYACSLPDMEPNVVGFLIGHGQILVNDRDRSHQTPLMVAARHGKRDVVDCLLEYGANPRLTDSRHRGHWVEQRGGHWGRTERWALGRTGRWALGRTERWALGENREVGTWENREVGTWENREVGTGGEQRGGHLGEQRGGHWGRTERWALGRPERWALGRTDRWALGRTERWALGRTERWALGRTGRWALGRTERWALGRTERWSLGENREVVTGETREVVTGGEQRGGHWGEQRGGHWGRTERWSLGRPERWSLGENREVGTGETREVGTGENREVDTGENKEVGTGGEQRGGHWGEKRDGQ